MAASPSPAPHRVPAVEILIEADGWPARAELEGLAAGVVEATVRAVGPRFAEPAELSLVFTDDARSRALNRRYRNTDRPTNVLSFPARAAGSPYGPMLGDIVLARETVFGEAQSEGLTIDAHIAHLILHGFLHILGYDHAGEAEALVMERLETEILGDLGIADPHAARS